MPRTTDSAHRRVMAMSEEDLRDAIKRLAGLEAKSAGTGCVGHEDAGGASENTEDTLSIECKSRPASPLWAGLADMVIHGRTRRGKDPGRR